MKAAAKIKNVVGLSNLEYVTTRGMRFEGDELYEEIEHAIEGRQFGVIILDSIYKLYDPDMDENSNSDVAHFLHKIEVLAARTNCSIVYSHHHSKGNQAGKNVKDRASGAGVFIRDIDTAVHFTEHQNDKSYTVEFTVRDFKTPEPFVVEVDWPDMLKNTAANPAALKTTAQKAVSHVQVILEVLAEAPITTTNLLRRLKTETNMSNGKFYEEWSKVKGVKGVVKDAEDRWFYSGASIADKICST